MSLIDEALKRAELEAARRDGLRGGPYPWVLERQPKRRRRWIAVAVIAVTVGAVAGGILWLRRAPAGSSSPSSAVSASSESKVQNPRPGVEMETVEVPPPPKGPSLRPPASSQKADVPPQKVDVPKAEGKAPAPKSPRTRAEKAVSESERAASPAEARPAPPSPASKAGKSWVVDGKTFVGEVDLPNGGKIALEGIVYSETNPVALINGRVLPPGGIIEEYAIVSIQPDRVELRNQGMTIFVKLK